MTLFVLVQDVQEEGKHAIDSPGSPTAPDLPPEEYTLGSLHFVATLNKAQSVYIFKYKYSVSANCNNHSEYFTLIKLQFTRHFLHTCGCGD
jgi:hypothetical protein